MVLIVDDDGVNRYVLETMLGKRQVSAESASGGEEAVQMTARQAFSLIFMDCHMPDVDGYTAAARIRARGASREARIVALSADASAENEARCRAAGMDDFAAKPLRSQQLDEILARWLDAD